MTVGSILGSLLLVAWSSVTSLGALYLILALIGVVSAMVLYEPAFAIIATWIRFIRASETDVRGSTSNEQDREHIHKPRNHRA
jgi:hypothetical protein